MNKDTEHNIAVIAQELQNIREIFVLYTRVFIDIQYAQDVVSWKQTDSYLGALSTLYEKFKILEKELEHSREEAA